MHGVYGNSCTNYKVLQLKQLSRVLCSDDIIKLNDYLKESLNMPYKWLKENAEEILNNETKEVGNET